MRKIEPVDYDTWLTQAEVAERLRFKTVQPVYALRRQGRLAWRPGRPVMISLAALKEYLNQEESRTCQNEPVRRGYRIDPTSTEIISFSGPKPAPEGPDEAAAYQRARAMCARLDSSWRSSFSKKKRTKPSPPPNAR
jgi:hypothetical protein